MEFRHYFRHVKRWPIRSPSSNTNLEIPVFWNMSPYTFLYIYQHFGEACCLVLQRNTRRHVYSYTDENVSEKLSSTIFRTIKCSSIILSMEAANASKTLVHVRCHTGEDSTFITTNRFGNSLTQKSSHTCKAINRDYDGLRCGYRK